MSRAAKTSLDFLVAEIERAAAAQEHREVLRLVDALRVTPEAATDITIQVRMEFHGATAAFLLEDWADAFIRYSRVTAAARGAKDLSGDLAEMLVLAFLSCAWAGAHLSAPDRDLMEVIDDAAATARALGVNRYVLFAEHIKSKVLLHRRAFREAADVAERALGRRRLSVSDGGCPLECYIESYIQSLAGLGDERVMKLVEEALADYPSSTLLWRMRGVYLFVEGRGVEALRDFNAMVQLAPSLDAYRLRALARANLGERDAALEDVREGLDLEPDDPFSLLWKAGFAGNNRGLERATRAEKWIAEVAKMWLRQKTFEDALQLASARTDAPSCLCELHAFAGLLAENEGRTEEAARHYRKAVATEMRGFYEFCWASARLHLLPGAR